MLQGLAQHASKVKFLLNENSTTILTAAGVGGTIATAYLTGKASFKAADLISTELEKKQLQVELSENNGSIVLPVRLSKTEKAKLVWLQFLPPTASGIFTIGCIITANKISSRKIAALTVAAGVSERALQEYKDKVVEKLGVRQDQKIRDDVAQDRVSANPGNSQQVIIAGTGEVLCYDMLTGRYFKSTMEDIKRAENKVNFELVQFMSCSLSHFYDEIGLSPTTYTDTVGWNMNNPMEVKFSSVISDDGRPCLAIEFSRNPTPDYTKHWDT
jgi:hypothetical protein